MENEVNVLIISGHIEKQTKQLVSGAPAYLQQACLKHRMSLLWCEPRDGKRITLEIDQLLTPHFHLAEFG